MLKELLVDINIRPVFVVDVINDNRIRRVARIEDSFAGNLEGALRLRERHTAAEADADYFNPVSVISFPAQDIIRVPGLYSTVFHYFTENKTFLRNYLVPVVFQNKFIGRFLNILQVLLKSGLPPCFAQDVLKLLG